jgi:hypothetical protein
MIIFLIFFFNFLISSNTTDKCGCSLQNIDNKMKHQRPFYQRGYDAPGFSSLCVADRLNTNSTCIIIPPSNNDTNIPKINTEMSIETIITYLNNTKIPYVNSIYTLESFSNYCANIFSKETNFTAGIYLKENPNNVLLHNINITNYIKPIYGEYNATTSLKILNKYKEKYHRYLIGSFNVKHDIDDINKLSPKENFEKYMQLAIATAYIFNTQEQKVFGNIIFPIGKLESETGEIKKIENSIEYLNDIVNKISHKSIHRIDDCDQDDVYASPNIIFYAKEDESHIIKNIKLIENLKIFYIKKKELTTRQINDNKSITDKHSMLYEIEIILTIINTYLNILYNINYIEHIEDLEKYNSGEKNINSFQLNEQERNDFKANPNLFSKIILLDCLTEQALKNNTECSEKLNTILSILFTNNIPPYFLRNKFYGMYIIEYNNNIVDTTIVPHEFACIPYWHNAKYPTIMINLDKFDTQLNKLYQENGKISIISSDSDIQSYDDLGCWGLLWSTIYAFNNNKINHKYYGYNIFPIGCINKEKSIIENPIYSDVGAIGFKIDDILNHIKREQLENNIIILSSSHKDDINHFIDYIRTQKQAVIKEKAKEYSVLLDANKKPTPASMDESSALVIRKKRIEIELFTMLSFFENFLKNNIHYAFDESHLKDQIIHQKYTGFSHSIIPKKIIKNYFRQIILPYDESNDKTEFRKNIFDEYENIISKINTLQQKTDFNKSIFGNFIKTISNIF